MVTPSEPQRSRAPVFIGLGLTIVALLGVVLFLGMREASVPPSASASVAAPPPPLNTVATAAPAPAPTPVQPQVLPSAAAPEPGAPVVRPQEPLGTKPKAIVPALASKPRPASPGVKATGSGDLSDFGGRR